MSETINPTPGGRAAPNCVACRMKPMWHGEKEDRHWHHQYKQFVWWISCGCYQTNKGESGEAMKQWLNSEPRRIFDEQRRQRNR